MLLIFQTEGELQSMRDLLKKEDVDKLSDKGSPDLSLNAADLPILPNHTPDHSGRCTLMNDTGWTLITE